MKRSLVICLFPVLAAISTSAQPLINGAGSSFVYPVMSKWSATYNSQTGTKINYQSVGSGAGINQIKQGTVTFGASDKPLASDELSSNPKGALAQFPVVIGGVVPVVNLPGIKPGELKLTGEVIADIFLGKVTKWNDPAIASLNSGVNLPDTLITVVHRSDGSGTTFNWSNYLSKVSGEWKSKVGEGTSIQWPTGVGGKGNEGVAAYTNQIQGSLGYVELAYVMQNHMTYTLLKNAAGKFVAPSVESFQAAAATADWSAEPDFHVVITNAPGNDSWPVAASVFVIMYRAPKDEGASAQALSFFKWALEKGQADAKSLAYVALPEKLVAQIEAYWSKEITLGK